MDEMVDHSFSWLDTVEHVWMLLNMEDAGKYSFAWLDMIGSIGHG